MKSSKINVFMMKKNYVKSIYETIDFSDEQYSHVDPRDAAEYERMRADYEGAEEMAGERDIMNRYNLDVNIEVTESEDGRIIHLEQDGHIIQIPEDKVDHYMSEIMGQLDSFPSDDEDDIDLDFPKF